MTSVRGTLVLLRLIEQVRLTALLEPRETSLVCQLCRPIRHLYSDVCFWIVLHDHPDMLRMVEAQVLAGVREPLDYELGALVLRGRRHSCTRC